MDDIRGKRKAGSGSFHKRGKGVKHGISGALKTPYFYMSNREKRKLNGEVKVYSMFTTIISLEEFQAKDKETQKNLLTKWRELYPNDDIVEGLGCGKKTFYDLITELEIPKKPRGGSVKRSSKKNKGVPAHLVAASPGTPKNEISSNPKDYEWLTKGENVKSLDILVEGIQKDIKELKQGIEEKEAATKQSLVTSGLHMEYNGSYDVEALNKLFTKLQLLIDGDTNKYNIKLSLTEIIEDRTE